MAILRGSGPENYEKFYLPSTSGLDEEQRAWVVMDIGPMITADTLGIKENMGVMEVSLMMLARRIKEWNFTDEALKPIDVSVTTISQMDLADVQFLSRQIPAGGTGELSNEQKKTSSDTSSTEPKVTSTTIPVIQSQ